MVFKKLLAGLGFGGVEVDTVLSPQPGTPGGSLTGQVNLRAKGDTDITAINLLLVASGTSTSWTRWAPSAAASCATSFAPASPRA
jgi:sporulation-control protein spo0M